MRNLRIYQKIIIVIAASIIAVVAVAYLKVIFTFPGELTLIEGEEYVYELNSLLPIDVRADRLDVLKLSKQDVRTASGIIGAQKPVSLMPFKNGTVNLNMRFFGLIPVKSVKVDVVSSKQLVACGNTVGVKMRIDGILVIGVSDVEIPGGQKVLPAKDTGIRPGCFITSVNGKQMKNVEELVAEINKSAGKSINVSFRNGTSESQTKLVPVIASDDKKYHIGLWVRDNTAGIGTLTFYDPVSSGFGALGHGITDIDTGTLMPVASGEIIESSILGIKAGKSGVPGELKGVFVDDTKLGSIERNSEYGIYGKLTGQAASKLNGKLYPIGLRSDIKEGPAFILSNIDGKKIEEYEIEIQKVSRQNLNGSKGMIIKITDKKLLEATGGIVQGMSGSPIIQNGRIIGAVTHVLVNDPTKGYGIFIESMLKNLEMQNSQSLKKAS